MIVAILRRIFDSWLGQLWRITRVRDGSCTLSSALGDVITKSIYNREALLFIFPPWRNREREWSNATKTASNGRPSWTPAVLPKNWDPRKVKCLNKKLCWEKKHEERAINFVTAVGTEVAFAKRVGLFDVSRKLFNHNQPNSLSLIGGHLQI